MASKLFNSLLGASGIPLLFDAMDLTHAGIWDLTKRRTDYAGYAVRVGLAADSGTTTLDIGFNADGTFDMATYEAFGTGSERVVVWYDQSGNGFDLSRAWSATLCPIIRTSSYNGKPALYFNGTGNLGNAGFTDWNGLANVNLIFACNVVGLATGSVYEGGSGKHQLWGGADNWYMFENGYSAWARYLNTWERVNGMLYRVRFCGTDTGDDRWRLYSNGQITGARDDGTGVGTTFTDETGIYINSAANGTSSCKNYEFYGAYYLGQNIDADWATIKAGIVADYYAKTTSQFVGSGDSLTVSYPVSVSDPTLTYPLQVVASLTTDTGRTWNLADINSFAEVGAALTRIKQLADLNNYKIDDWQLNRIVVCWGGTNDLGIGGTYGDALTAANALAQAWLDYGASKVYFLNMLPRTDLGAGNAAFETARGNFNSGLAAALPGGVDIIDVAAITELQDSTDTDYFGGDEVHLNLSGYTLVAAAVVAAIEADL